MRIKYNKPFHIPRRLGDKFRVIVGIKGVRYIKGKGFIVKDKSSIDAMNKILAKMGLILLPTIICYICGGDIACEECESRAFCKQNVLYCICNECFINEYIVNRYFSIHKNKIEDLIRE